ncbi:hypothetical protein [Staphylococcus hominis]|uniref:hypothetical protein n=1 Tax=Staphylococcus hominis TaxID=1290 RepID=UPI003BFA6A56
MTLILNTDYNDTEQEKNQSTLIKHQALMRGFLVAEFADDFEHASKEMATWI